MTNQEQEPDESIKSMSKEERVDLFLGSIPELQMLFNPYPIMSGIGDRMIGLSNGKMIFAIVVMETPEELIVCYPASLFREPDDSITGKLMVGATFTKIYKSNTTSICEVEAVHKLSYYSFLLSFKDRLNKSIFSKQRLDLMESFVRKYGSTTKTQRVLVKPDIDKLEAADSGVPHFEVIPYQSDVKH